METTVTIGPVPTSSAVAWISAARETVRVLRERADLAVPGDVIDAFEHFMGVWSEHADRHPDSFHWTGIVDSDVVRTIGLHWARIVSVARSGREADLSSAPPEAAAFYDAIASAIAAALAESEAAPLADAFRDAVPQFDARHPRPPGDPIRVLVVDDQDEIRLLLRVWLEGDPGFEVVGEADDGARAIEVARATAPDVVILDVEMPGMSGLDALPLLRAAVPDCAVVVFSAGEFDAAALAAGATAFLSKVEPLAGVLDVVRAAKRAAGPHDDE